MNIHPQKQSSLFRMFTTIQLERFIIYRQKWVQKNTGEILDREKCCVLTWICMYLIYYLSITSSPRVVTPPSSFRYVCTWVPLLSVTPRQCAPRSSDGHVEHRSPHVFVTCGIPTVSWCTSIPSILEQCVIYFRLVYVYVSVFMNIVFLNFRSKLCGMYGADIGSMVCVSPICLGSFFRRSQILCQAVA